MRVILTPAERDDLQSAVDDPKGTRFARCARLYDTLFAATGRVHPDAEPRSAEDVLRAILAAAEVESDDTMTMQIVDGVGNVVQSTQVPRRMGMPGE